MISCAFIYLNFTGLVSREYCAPLYPHALPAYLSEDLLIISSGFPHHYNRAFYNIRTLKYRRKKQCYKDKVILDSQPTQFHNDYIIYYILDSQPTQFHNETTRKTLKNNFESYANVVVETCVETR